ncbi:FadR/GntR family transcriptional regulator [Marispirochaeta sp.]|jgi:GntR family transcriptional regulator, transcriptional repressor for pyruvate dehydrogenase complex|uniref:FadR/GntR family transcriptional regulator n=1 Tax=Marispirochaeta sp. TaxID=2038653 RepID=UPI0029C707D8|nr:FadR/GntR family transcriptional regulator [Marispirochaeta sp.]
MPSKRPKVYEEVVATLEHIIDRDNLTAGDRLPSESELAEMMEVGTRSIREAYTTLRTMGIVEVQHGKGIFLAENSMDHFLESLATSIKFTYSDTRTLLLELTDVRLLIETGIIHDFALQRSDEDIKNLTAIVDDMRKFNTDQDLNNFNLKDLEFHAYLVQSIPNRIIKSLYIHLQRLLRQSIELTQYYGGEESLCLDQHKMMLELIEKGDGEGARRVLFEHLRRTRNTVESLEL